MWDQEQEHDFPQYRCNGLFFNNYFSRVASIEQIPMGALGGSDDGRCHCYFLSGISFRVN